MARKVGRLMKIDQIIGKRIKARRIFLGFSRQELAEKIGVTHQQVQKYENGSNRISAGRLYAIAEAINVAMSFFFDNVEEESAANQAELPNEGQRMCIEVARNFMKINNQEFQSMINSLVKTLASS
ncbi:helix-turn-helix domain-containing protein [Rickettsiales endosymbiont of Stachyamoeba lipophora]|uniref:helix-turn-helix domain-containing protein n=1 Tax=Rickettsiales endosymbiont of Stachyamoeba lipophora TaxID=2486578 RepID=UPI000F648C00|nr:helix-turn-helix transcriptional regulator [Rickettsiales endosymbiont of Stachyamoeba lipophora]AZL16123.1 XRE family transcriptional regulator [Rickettsiales endosymbiont of Stachyamoeba lipophora]